MSVHAGPNIVESGLVLALDAANPKSYPGTGTTWFDISGNGNHFTLYNGPTFSNGALTFDGTNDYARTNNIVNFNNYSYIIVDIFVKTNTISGGMLYEVTSNWNTVTGGFGLAPHSNGNTLQQDLHHTNHKFGSFSGNNTARNYFFTVGTNWANHINIYSKISDATGRLTYGNGGLISYTTTGGYTTGTSTPAGSFANDHMYIASRGGTGSYCPCSISSIKVYGIKLDSNNIQQNFNALRGRYGI
jgi:hypothetical protein